MSAYIVGMTGGIGSGKSTISAMFADLGIDVIDADVEARALLAKGGKLVGAVLEKFGKSIETASGEIDRAALRKIVFSSDDARRELEALTHPAVRESISAKVSAAKSEYAIVVVPLLFEKGYEHIADRVLCIDLDPDEQVRRASQRDGVSDESIRLILAAQMQRADRVSRSDDVFYNAGSDADKRAKVAVLHDKYLMLARSRG